VLRFLLIINIKKIPLVGITAALIFVLIVTACETNKKLSEYSEIQNSPAWLRFPPQEEGYYFGIGGDSDLSEARMKSVINVGQKFSVHVKSSLYEKNMVNSGMIETVMAGISEELTDQEVVGAKFYDQYLDDKGNYWVLTRAPLNCILDVTESVLLSYRLELKQDSPLIDELIRDVENSMLEANGLYYKEPRKPGKINMVGNGSVTIDGKPDDWDFEAFAAGTENESIRDYRDITAVFLAEDEKYLYIRVDFRGGIPKAVSNDNTYDLAFNANGKHIELWCLKNGFSTAVHTTGLVSSDGFDGFDQQQLTSGCLTKTGESFLESRFPLDSIRGDSLVPITINATYRVRDGGREEFDSLNLPSFEL